MIRWALAGAIAALAGLGMWLRPAPAPEFAPLPMARVGTGAEFDTVFAYQSPEGTAHAPAIVRQGAGFDLIWFDGLRESHNDVRILRSDVLSGEVQELIRRQTLSARTVPPQTVLTLGNTIQYAQGYLATVVSLGGWAASSVMLDDGERARKLSLSPVLNRSHLVKSPVVAMRDGWHMVPSYFEMGTAYGVTALVDRQGRVRAQSAMLGGEPAIQPMVVPFNATQAVALLRRFGREQDKLLASWTQDVGQSWSAPEALDLPNPSAPVAAVLLDDDRLLMLFNDDTERADTLVFAVSDDQGKTWQRTRVLDGPGKGNLRYPMMDVLGDGRIAVTYSTGSKAGIVAHVLSADWALGQ